MSAAPEDVKPPEAGSLSERKERIKLRRAHKLFKTPGALYAWPMGAWFTVFFVIPLVIIILYSFLEKGLYGGVVWKFSFEAYRQMFNPKYGIILLRTVKIALISTLVTILIALPCGYAMARSKRQTMLLILVIIPFWTNSLIRIFAWMSILGNDGIVNSLLRQLGIVSEYAKLLYNQNAVILVSVYMYLPYAILPVFTSIDRFDFSLLEAARDLGATKPQSMFKVLLPNIKSGVVTAIIFTFIPIFGAYTVPLLVGGKDSYMIGNIIVDQVNKTRNWPLAAAFSMIITVVSMLGVLWMMNSGKKDAALKDTGKTERGK
ncbi:ABC transporter permease [Treponema brennaborense]|uniref:ABC-type transporter, integral membrane subunit n=1 Tax=Treponema brennaborense (strain DSM 12168 / CIP 105900 / DD5/3) TaxID=906968 RepID=F4LPU8_TREBD|nr:ABC-type transporter, integral membrane subunit [Treponema brennaborense DSM 12168]